MLFRKVLLDELGVVETEVAAVENAVAAAIEDAVSFAEKSPDPRPDDWKQYIFAGESA